MSDSELSDEEQVDESLTNSEVTVKYRTAGQIVTKTAIKLVEELQPGRNILELCELGDKILLEEAKNTYKNKKSMERGIAFPTSISVNNVVGHYSPEAGDKAVLKDGDVVKIDLGVHLDGFIAVIAHTHIVGNSQVKPTSGKAADVVCATHLAAEAVLRLLQPGNKNTDIAPVVQKIADTFKVNPVEAVLSHQLKRFVIDGTKVIPNKAVVDQAVEEFEFEENDVYGIDIVMSTGTGKTREQELRPTIYKRVVDQNYSLKLQAARKIFSEINEKHPALPFTLRWLEDKHVRFGLGEIESHGLVQPYPVLYEKENEIVAQFKYTVLVGPNGPTRITDVPLPYVQSQYSIEDQETKDLLAQSVTAKKKGGKRKAKKSKTGDVSKSVNMEIS